MARRVRESRSVLEHKPQTVAEVRPKRRVVSDGRAESREALDEVGNEAVNIHDQPPSTAIRDLGAADTATIEDSARLAGK